MVEESLLAYLANAGTPAGSRVYPVKLPDGATLPAITYQRLPLGDKWGSHSGPGNLVTSVFQLTCWGATYQAAKQLAGVVVPLLDHYKGPMGGSTCQGAFVDLDDLDQFDKDGEVYQTILQVSIWT